MKNIYVVNRLYEGNAISSEKAFILKSDAEKYAENRSITCNQKPEFLTSNLEIAILDVDAEIEDFDCDYYETLITGLKEKGYSITKEQLEQYFEYSCNEIVEFTITEVELVK